MQLRSAFERARARAVARLLLERGIPALLTVLGLLWCVARLWRLETRPWGLSMDEALAGLHVQCLAETGRSADGTTWPFFAQGLGGGLYTPTYLYPLYAWSRAFGSSIASIRAMNVVFNLIAIAGVGALGRLLAGPRAAWLAWLAAALSPWSFQLSRLAADAPIAPAFLVWGIFFFLRGPRWFWAALGGVFLALAAYSYPPVRVQTAGVVPLLLVVARVRGELTWTRAAWFLGPMAVVAAPLVLLTLDGTLTGRSAALSILNPDYIRGHRHGLSAPVFVAKELLDNLHLHLRPSYLFFTGDPNLRHSTQRIGALGALDVLALLIVFGGSTAMVVRLARQQNVALGLEATRALRVALFAAVVIALGILPAALCWEGLPHAYRSIGAYPAVALLSGAAVAVMWRVPSIRMVALLLALVQTATFFPDYFGPYGQRAAEPFDASLRVAAERHDMRAFSDLARHYPSLGFRYYLTRNFGYDCQSSLSKAEQILTPR